MTERSLIKEIENILAGHPGNRGVIVIGSQN